MAPSPVKTPTKRGQHAERPLPTRSTPRPSKWSCPICSKYCDRKASQFKHIRNHHPNHQLAHDNDYDDDDFAVIPMVDLITEDGNDDEGESDSEEQVEKNVDVGMSLNYNPTKINHRHISSQNQPSPANALLKQLPPSLLAKLKSTHNESPCTTKEAISRWRISIPALDQQMDEDDEDPFRMGEEDVEMDVTCRLDREDVPIQADELATSVLNTAVSIRHPSMGPQYLSPLPILVDPALNTQSSLVTASLEMHTNDVVVDLSEIAPEKKTIEEISNVMTHTQLPLPPFTSPIVNSSVTNSDHLLSSASLGQFVHAFADIAKSLAEQTTSVIRRHNEVGRIQNGSESTHLESQLLMDTLRQREDDIAHKERVLVKAKETLLGDRSQLRKDEESFSRRKERHEEEFDIKMGDIEERMNCLVEREQEVAESERLLDDIEAAITCYRESKARDDV